MAVTVRQWLETASRRLHEAGVDSATLDAKVLLCHALGKEPHFPFLCPDYIVEAQAAEILDSWVQRRAKKEPIAYIIGKKEFWSLDFIVTCDTLIPRPDSETIVQALLDTTSAIAIQHHSKAEEMELEIADIGTGTGCLLISALKTLLRAKGTAIDIKSEALEIARRNSELHGTCSRMEFIESNWLEKIDRKFDIIVSNPPYIALNEFAGLMEDVKQYEPASALVSGQDGMDSYRMIATQAKTRLKENGYVILETGSTQTSSVAGIFMQQGFEILEIRRDMAGLERCVIARTNNDFI